jgi:hypothetical protein
MMLKKSLPMLDLMIAVKTLLLLVMLMKCTILRSMVNHFSHLDLLDLLIISLFQGRSVTSMGMTYCQTLHHLHVHLIMDQMTGLPIITEWNLKLQTFYIIATRCPAGTLTLSSTFGQPLWQNMVIFCHSPVITTCMVPLIRHPSVPPPLGEFLIAIQ